MALFNKNVAIKKTVKIIINKFLIYYYIIIFNNYNTNAIICF